MPKKKQAKKKTARPARKNRSRNVNGTMAHSEPPPRREAERQREGPKNICSNAECRLRRAGCYGYEACPGYKERSR